MSDLQDKKLACSDCGKEFVFTVKEQEFYKEKGFENEPKRCSDCRRAKKEGNQRYDIVCAECGKEDTVPFPPRNDSPLYCRDCFSKRRDVEHKEAA